MLILIQRQMKMMNQIMRTKKVCKLKMNRKQIWSIFEGRFT
ncbi:hypothetical protein OROGR_028941 [Orobanche gracilis]